MRQAQNAGKEEEIIKWHTIFRICSIAYLALVVEVPYVLERPVQLFRTIASCSDSDAKIFFRFRKPDLGRLCTLLRFPPTVTLDNRLSMPGEEVFLRGLYELSSGDMQHGIASHVFGREQSSQSRAFTWFFF
eukprot:gene29263-35327_t